MQLHSITVPSCSNATPRANNTPSTRYHAAHTLNQPTTLSAHTTRSSRRVRECLCVCAAQKLEDHNNSNGNQPPVSSTSPQPEAGTDELVALRHQMQAMQAIMQEQERRMKQLIKAAESSKPDLAGEQREQSPTPAVEASSFAPPSAAAPTKEPTTAATPERSSKTGAKTKRSEKSRSSTPGPSTVSSKSSDGSSKEDLAQKLNEMNAMNAQLVELLHSKGVEAPASLLQSTQPLAAQLERLNSAASDSGASGASTSGRTGSGRVQGKSSRKRDSANAASAVSAWSPSLWQRIESGQQQELPPPVDNPFASLPRMPPSKIDAATAEASAAAKERASAPELQGPTRPSRSSGQQQQEDGAEEDRGSVQERPAVSGRQAGRSQGRSDGVRTDRKSVAAAGEGAERRRSSAGSSSSRMPPTEVERMLAAGRQGPPTSMMSRIWGCSRWQDLQRLATTQQRSLDTYHTVVLLARLAAVAPSFSTQTGSKGAAGESASGDGAVIRAFAAELATLLQLQLPRLSPPVLSAVVHSVGLLSGSPKPAWVDAACSAAERAAPKMAAFQLVALSYGLARLNASPSPSFFACFWASTKSAMAQGRLSQLPQLSLAAATAALFQQQGALGSAGSKKAGQSGVHADWSWLLGATAAATAAGCGVAPPEGVVQQYKEWQARQQAGRGDSTPVTDDSTTTTEAESATASTSTAAETATSSTTTSAASTNTPDVPASSELSFELGSAGLDAKAAVSFVCAAHELGLSEQLDKQWVIRLLLRAAAVEGSAGKETNTSSASGLQQCSAEQLVSLGHALADLPAPPPSALTHAYATALWPKLDQLPPASALPVFEMLVERWGYVMPAQMVHSFLVQVTPGKSDGTGGAGGLSAVSTPVLSSFVVSLASCVSSAREPVSLDYLQLEALQQELAARSLDDLAPCDKVDLLRALADIQHSRTLSAAAIVKSRGSGKVGSSKNAAAVLPGAALPAFHGALLSAVFRSLRQQLDTTEPATIASLCTTVAKTGAQMDIDLLEAFLSQCVGPDQTSNTIPSQQLLPLVIGLGEMAAHAREHGNVWRPRYSVLGPFMARFVQALPGCSPEMLVRGVSALAHMQLSKEDLQGVRATTAGGVPSPSELSNSCLAALEPHLSALPMPQLARLATGLVALGAAAPSQQWAASFVGRCREAVIDARVPDLLSLLAALPSITLALTDGGVSEEVQGVAKLTEACADRVKAGVAELDLPALTDLMEAVSSSSSTGVSAAGGMAAALMQSSSTGGAQAPHTFVGAVLQASAPKLEAADFPTHTRLAAAVAQAGAVPSVDWLHALQSATAPHVLKANEANAAELIWAVAKLAKAASTTDSTSTVAHSLLLPQWRVAFEQRVGAQRPGVGEAYGLVDLARLLWAAATLQARPRPGLLNSFAGKSIDRMSGLPPQLVLDSAWATATLGAQMTPRWLNQWTAAVQGPTITRLSPEDLCTILCALHYHCTTPTKQQDSPPLSASSVSLSAALLEALSNRLGHFLLSEATTTAHPPFTPSQLVQMSTALACFGHTPGPDTSHALAASLQSAAEQQQQGSQVSLNSGELIAALWSQARVTVQPPPGFTTSILACLESSIAELTQLQIVRLLWSLASLQTKPALVPSSLLDRCEYLLTSSDKQLTAGDLVDVLSSLTMLGRPLPEPQWQACMARLTNRTSTLSPSQLCCLLAATAESSNTLAPALANEVSKVAASRFSIVTPIELTDLMYSFARLGLSLAPALASTAIKRLQSSLTVLPTRQLACTLWALSTIGYTPLKPQLQAYQQQVLAVVPEMTVSDAALVLDAFSGFNYRVSEDLLDALEARTLQQLQDVALGQTYDVQADAETDAALQATSGDMILVLQGLSRSGRMPSQPWLVSWFTMLRADSLAALQDKQVLAVLDLLAGNTLGMQPKQRWCAALLQRLLPMLSSLESKPLQSVLAVLAMWEEQGMATGSGEASTTPSLTQPQTYQQLRDEFVHLIPSLISAKLFAYDAVSVVNMMYDMFLLRAKMPQPLVQRGMEQVEQGLQSGLPTSSMVKLCTALSEHAACVCRTGDGVLAVLADQDEELDAEGLMQETGSPLLGFPLKKAWLLQDEILSRLQLDSCEDSELAAVVLSVQGMVSCLQTSSVVQNQCLQLEAARLPQSMQQTLFAETDAETEQGMRDALSKDDLKTLQRFQERYWQFSGFANTRIFAVDGTGKPWDSIQLIAGMKALVQAELAPEDMEPLENDGLVVMRPWVRQLLKAFQAKLRAGSMSSQAMAQVLPAFQALNLPTMRDQQFLDECLSYAKLRMAVDPPEDLAHLAWAFAVCKVAPAEAWVEELLTALTAPEESLSDGQAGGNSGSSTAAEQSSSLQMSSAVVLDLTQALQAWGIQNVKQALTPQRWSALLGACDQGVQQGLFSPTDAALLLGNLCSLSKEQASLSDEWVVGFANTAVLQHNQWTADSPYWVDPESVPAELADGTHSLIEPQAVAALLNGLVKRNRGMPKALESRKEQLLGIVALQAGMTTLDVVTQVFVAAYQLGLRPSAPWVETMQRFLASQQREGSNPAALRSASTWLEALQRL